MANMDLTTLFESANNTHASEDDAMALVSSNSILEVDVGIEWRGIDCVFNDWLHISNLKLWRDFLPPELETELNGLHRDDTIQHHFTAGELVPGWQSSQLQRIKRDQFKPPLKGLEPIEPTLGRFYPKDFFKNVPEIVEGNKFPCRITEINEDELLIDLNHPLASKAITLTLRIASIKHASSEQGGRCNDIPAMICDHGPGLQDDLAQAETDFMHGKPFARINESDDADYYQTPRLTPYWDSLGLQQVSTYYRQLIPQGAHILDLMAGVHSPLQQAEKSRYSVSCAGLNLTELENNPVCSERIQLDVNSAETLPFADQQFDVVLIHAAIEYVTHPQQLMLEIGRVLKAEGKIIISFSNRSEGEKCISLWARAHEFERPGIVLSYLRSAGCFADFQSFSHRGHLRPENDELANRLLHSDPVYLITANRT